MLLSTLVGNVRKILDLNNASATLIDATDIDALSLKEIVEDKIPIAARYIEENAPLHLLDGGTAITASSLTFEEVNGKYITSIALEDDFMRLVNFRMSDWKRNADVIYGEDERYKLLSSPWGLTGTVEQPVVAIVRYPLKNTLEIYSCSSSSATIKSASYLALPKVISGNIDICSKLQSAIEYYAAYLTCLTYGNANLASYLLQQAMTLAEIPVSTNNKE